MGVYQYTKKVKNKKTKEMVDKVFYMYAGKYTDPLTKKRVQYKKRGFESTTKASKAESDFLALVRAGTGVSITYDNLYNIYYENRKDRIKKRSLSDIDYTYRLHIKPTWGDIKISDINLNKLEIWQSKLLQLTYCKKTKINNETKIEEIHYSNEYLRTIQSMFKTILKYGSKIGYKVEPSVLNFELVKNSSEHKKEMLFWEPDEYKKFISVVDDVQYKALFSILYWCGLRLGEALALRFCDINLLSGELSINRNYDQKNRIFTSPKTNNSYRTAIMPNQCLEAVKAWIEASHYYDADNSHIVFGIDQPLDDNTIRNKKDKWCEKAGVKRIRIHDFRHSHVSLLIDLGFNAFDIAKRLGHTTEMVNNRYGHWFKSAQNKMVEKLNNV